MSPMIAVAQPERRCCYGRSAPPLRAVPCGRADSNFESIARRYGADAGSRQHTPVQETVARLIAKFAETKPLLGAEPFDDRSDWRAGRHLEPGLGEPGLCFSTEAGPRP